MGLARLLIFVALILGLWWLWRRVMQMPPEQARRYLITGSIVAVIVVLALLAVTGRLPPLFAAIATAVGGVLAIVQRLLRMPWALALAQRLFHEYRFRKTGSPTSAGPRSQVEARFIRMYLDQESGEIGGEVVAGRLAGYRLDELDLAQLAGLWHEYRAQDTDSAALLEAYLERIHGEGWRARAGAGEEARGQTANTDGAMSVDEARKILGVDQEASEEDIVAAHRRLAQRLHPDRGGSDYLAAKINRAKEVLLKK